MNRLLITITSFLLGICHGMDQSQGFLVQYPKPDDLGVALFSDPTLVHSNNNLGNTLLHEFILEIDSKKITWPEAKEYLGYFLQANTNLHSLNNNNLTPLHLAASKSHQEIAYKTLKKMIQHAVFHKIDINPANSKGVTPLHLASVSSSLTQTTHSPILLFLDHKINVNAQTIKKETPLQWLHKTRSTDFTACPNAKALIDAGADTSFLPQRPSSPISVLPPFIELIKNLI